MGGSTNVRNCVFARGDGDVDGVGGGGERAHNMRTQRFEMSE